MKMIKLALLFWGGLLSLLSVASAQDQNPMARLLPQYISWAQEIDRQGLQKGMPLSKANLELAADIGIQFPEKVRVVYVDSVPYPYEDPALKAMGESLGLIGEGISNNAQVFGYSIYVRKGYKLDRPRMAHELVHVLQVERSSFSEVVVQHIRDLANYDYRSAPLEVEAFKANKKYAIK
ncbi:hypothetical protein [uncultured Shewanella sp.]|uniref:hypothetical protein n=1 Tax=uncultured Shewanella sp. TaxID=173975 RepID=UPI00260B266D|nr:hypothetical protein [uncultured Shewanella sp.]